MTSSSPSYESVTEIAGEEVTSEQVQRLVNRYVWAGEHCFDRDVLEVACGTGPGLGYLQSRARTLVAGDISETLVAKTKAHYGDRVLVEQLNAHQLQFDASSFDVVLLFEAIYYLDANLFFSEARRVLRPGGKLLVVTANKDLYDFNASPHSTRYLGVHELAMVLASFNFSCEFFGDSPVDAVGYRQRALRPLKRLAVHLNLIPQTMIAKRFLKRLVFGRLTEMPAEIREEAKRAIAPARIKSPDPDRRHKVLYCVATKQTG